MDAIQIADFVYMLSFLAFFGYEGYALLNETEGDTFSERTRHYFRTEGKPGAFIFLAMFGMFSTWFAAHIVQIPI